jgi:hypothetical protein
MPGFADSFWSSDYAGGKEKDKPSGSSLTLLRARDTLWEAAAGCSGKSTDSDNSTHAS